VITGVIAAERDRPVGVEARKTYAAKLDNGFIDKYLSGLAILDIGYKGYENNVVPIVPQAIGIDVDYPGYDGHRLPFPDKSQDAVFSSHCLEHIDDAPAAIGEWFRVLKINGFLVLSVPHQHLYERKSGPPSIWNPDHRRFYTPASLLIELEKALEPNTYRIRHLVDNDTDYNYSIPPDQHPSGCYEIELVIQRIKQPEWHLDDDARMDAPSAIPPSDPLGSNCPTSAELATGADNEKFRCSIFDPPASRRISALAFKNFSSLQVIAAGLRRIRRRLASGSGS
jgi:SAM-dependent methyltransferase